jgi:hypothetical protein
MTANEYQEINFSFKKKCVYRIGSGAGFFSEINNMVMAMIYCLENKLRFQLYSSGSTCGDDLWKDYFMPFTEHTEESVHYLFNNRPYIIIRQFYPLTVDELFAVKKILARQILTQDVWPYIRNNYNVSYEVKTPYLNGKLTEVTFNLIECIWKYNDTTSNEIKTLTENLGINKEFASIHIRRGDKNKECPHTPVKSYFKIVDEVTGSRDYPVFLASDDYNVITEAKELYPDRIIYHFSFLDNIGYESATFQYKLSKELQKEKIIKFLAEIELLKKGNIFVGSFSSNIGMFMGMVRPQEEVFGVDFNSWFVV